MRHPILLLVAALLCFAPVKTLAKERAVREWSVYVHLNADNNLSPFGVKDLAEMKAAMAAPAAWITVAYDNTKRNDSKLVTLNGSQETVLESGAEYDMGDWQLMVKMANRAFDEYPGKHNLIVIWNHGASWTLTTMGNEAQTKGVSYDDTSGNHMTPQQVGMAMQAINQKHHIDILGYDACLMAAIETGYELRGLVDYILASEETEPGDGWQYTDIVRLLAKSPSPVELGKGIIDSYIKQYPSGATLSLADGKKLMELGRELDFVAVSSIGSPELAKAISVSTPYAYPENKDLGQFLNAMPNDITAKAKSLYLETVIYSKNTKPGTGLTAYLEADPVSKYRDLLFSKETRWFDMLASIK